MRNFLISFKGNLIGSPELSGHLTSIMVVADSIKEASELAKAEMFRRGWYDTHENIEQSKVQYICDD